MIPIRAVIGTVLAIGLNTPCVAGSSPLFQSATNHWVLEPEAVLERLSFVAAPTITADGAARDDSFWMASDEIALGGKFDNDVWAFASTVRLSGVFADHARVIARTVHLDGIVSNGLWAAGLSVATTTNSQLRGTQLIAGDTLTLLGHIDGDVFARGRQVTLGGEINGDVLVSGQDIIVRPGTIIRGDFRYITTNQTLVLDANSRVEGTMRRMEPPAASTDFTWSPGTSIWLEIYWFAASLLVGALFMLLFPGITGRSVQSLRGSMVKCGLIGLASVFGLPFVLFLIVFTVVGIPLALVLGASYGLLLYLGKIPLALALGSALLQRRGAISLTTALVALVVGLFLFYGMSLVPYLGSSLQTAATAFGTGSLILGLAAGRGRVGIVATEKTEQP
ncbi:MAG TPA: polymer-forming cytoskeletal protein [Kiritimatiellia bacterium]|nr:polymer-forming cytoskeletal protein [Kiritimatiellia bacterium]